jgi:OmpA-OmpF porin, OOP family
MKSFKLLIFGCCLLAMPIFVFAQKKYWEASATIGAMNYYGDLTPPVFTIKEIHAGGQLSIRRFFDREHALRINILHGKLSGNDRNFDRNYLRNNSFDGSLTEIAFLGEKDFKGRKRFSSKLGYQKTNSFYLFGGGSVAYFNPNVRYGDLYEGDKNVEYVNWHIGMPIGGGFRIDASEKLVFSLELGYRFTISDFLDGTQATGNAYKNDSYTFGGVSVGYRFFDKEKPKEEVKTKAQKRAEKQQQ